MHIICYIKYSTRIMDRFMLKFYVLPTLNIRSAVVMFYYGKHFMVFYLTFILACIP